MFHPLLFATTFSVLLLPVRTQVAPTREQKEKLESAEQLLHGPYEARIREGAKLCLEVGNAAAVQLLIDVLNREDPHARDIAWEVLPDFKDPYARRVVSRELKTNKRNEGVREWCAQLLGLYGDAALADPLVDELSDSHATVRAAAARSLGQLEYLAAVKKLEKLVTDKDFLARANAIEALAAIDPKAYVATFYGGLKDADGGVRCALLGALPRLYPERAESTSADLLADPDWRPRMQAVENLGAIRTKTAVDTLVLASGDVRPVVAAKASSFLQKLSGKKFTLKEQWALWWKETRPDFEFPPEPEPAAKKADGESDPTAPKKSDGTTDPATPKKPEAADDSKQTRASYHGLLVTSDHVSFVIDKSQDMSKDLGKGGSKDDAARKELEQTLGRLQGIGFVFEAWTYGNDLKKFAKEPVVLDPKSERALLKWIEAEPCAGSKNIWQVLETVLSDAELDTIYLLSSGEPEVGVYVHWNRVCDQFANLNRFHKVVVHTVAYSDSKWYRDQMEHIATSTGGSFVYEE